PDIFVIDKASRSGLIIEIGISCPRDLLCREAEKYRKYEILAGELKAIHSLKDVNISSLVWSWDGVVSKRHRLSAKLIGLSKGTLSYIQGRIIKRTVDMYLSAINDKSWALPESEMPDDEAVHDVIVTDSQGSVKP
ncbi:MAG: hypothetical protein MHMPM18_004956, partial [Marteilia pararefringens]